MATGQVGFKDQKKVKRVYVAKRENPIVNRLNKTKVEKFPDFRQEKEDRARDLRKKDRTVIAAKVRQVTHHHRRDTLANSYFNRQRKRPELQEKEKSWHTREITHTMSGTRKNRSWPLATRTVTRTGKTTSCRGIQVNEINGSRNIRLVSQVNDTLALSFAHNLTKHNRFSRPLIVPASSYSTFREARSSHLLSVCFLLRLSFDQSFNQRAYQNGRVTSR